MVASTAIVPEGRGCLDLLSCWRDGWDRYRVRVISHDLTMLEASRQTSRLLLLGTLKDLVFLTLSVVDIGKTLTSQCSPKPSACRLRLSQTIASCPPPPLIHAHTFAISHPLHFSTACWGSAFGPVLLGGDHHLVMVLPGVCLGGRHVLSAALQGEKQPRPRLRGGGVVVALMRSHVVQCVYGLAVWCVNSCTVHVAATPFVPPTG